MATNSFPAGLDACGDAVEPLSAKAAASTTRSAYLDPPADAVMVSMDGNNQSRPADRTQPGLPGKKGRCGTMARDDTRHDTTALLGVLRTRQVRLSNDLLFAVGLHDRL